MIESIVLTQDMNAEQRAALERLLADGFPHEPTDLLSVEIARSMDQRIGIGLLAVRGEQLLGALLARKPFDGRHFVVYLAVATPWRRQGIARTLLNHLVAGQSASLEMFVDSDNSEAAHLYRSGGLTPDDEDAPAGQQHWSGTWNTQAGLGHAEGGAP